MSTDSPQKKGRGDYAGLHEPQQDRMHEACATEIVLLGRSGRMGKPALWMGLYLKPGKSSHTRATYFKPEGASSTFYPAKVNANLV